MRAYHRATFRNFLAFRITDANQHGETFCSIEGQVRELEQLSSPIVSVQPQKHVAEGKYASTCSLQKQLPTVARASVTAAKTFALRQSETAGGQSLRALDYWLYVQR